MISKLVTALQHIDAEITAEDIADALWLALEMKKKSAEGSEGVDRKLSDSGTKSSDGADELLSQTNASTPLAQPPVQTDGTHNQSMSSGLYPGSSPGSNGKGKSMGTLPFRSPAGTALPGSREIARTLRSFRRNITLPGKFVLNEEATAKRIAEEGLWVPVLDFASTRWLEVALVVDKGASMTIWRQTSLELYRLLAGHGAFRDVRLWELDTNYTGKVYLYAGTGAGIQNQQIRSERELIDTSGRRLILVLTDCVSPAWHSGIVAKTLGEWGYYNAVTIVRVLPQRLWSRTALGMIAPVRLHASTPGTPNKQLLVQATHYRGDENKEYQQRIAIPIITLEPRPLIAWSRAIARAENVWIPGFELAIPSPSAKKPEQNGFDLYEKAVSITLPPAECVQRFRADASSPARRLAGLLATVPITLPIIRLVQQAMFHEPRQVHVAEVFLSGLLEVTSANSHTLGPEAIQYDFVDSENVRELLLNSVSPNDSGLVLTEISTFIASRPGHALDFRALLANPLAREGVVIDEENRHFALMGAKALRRFGGEYVALADWLEEQSSKGEELDSRTGMDTSVYMLEGMDGQEQVGEEVMVSSEQEQVVLSDKLADDSTEMITQEIIDSDRMIENNTSGDEMSHPKVFISYSHDSAEHADRVLALSDRLRADGIDCILDQYEVSPPEGFPRWMDRQIRAADFVLMICTATYYRRVMGGEEPDKGLGVSWESNEIYQSIYDAGTSNARFIPVLPEEDSVSDIPLPWRGVTYYRAFSEEGYEALYRRLTNQPLTRKPDFGKLRQLPPRQRRQTFIGTMLNEHSTHPVTSVSSAAGATAEGSVQVPVWNVPYARNALFTGREDILTRLHTALNTGKTMALSQPQAIIGLGGIGKTQTAVEYAYRFRDDYQFVLWVQANTQETLLSSFVALATQLNLPEQNDQEQRIVVQAVKQWLETHSRWLLIVDTADDLVMVRDYLPVGNQGHILLTTRAQAMGGLARKIELDTLGPEEGAVLLLRRAGLIPPDATLESVSTADRARSRDIVQAMGGLPLALDQAGAYLEETGESLSNYLGIYQQERTVLLNRRGGSLPNHPESVATTWSLALQQVARDRPAAIELMRVCAFLAPDAIPEELLVEGAPYLGPVLEPVAADRNTFNEALAALLKYSLLRRDTTTHILIIHRLVQAVILDELDEETQRRWAERVVRAVRQVFPFDEPAPWPLSQRYLAQALACEALIKQWDLTFDEAAGVLNNAGWYLRARGQYREAEPLLHDALTIGEKRYGFDHPDTSYLLNNLALLYVDQGKYEEAEPLYQRALAIKEKVLGPEHPDTAQTLNNLALLYADQGKYEEAEPLYQRALQIREQALGPDHPDVAYPLNNLASLDYEQGKYAEAEPLYQRALQIREQALGPDHPLTREVVRNYADLLRKVGREPEATQLEARFSSS
jgi:tetratricopeptide (TPR) repeat protein